MGVAQRLLSPRWSASGSGRVRGGKKAGIVGLELFGEEQVLAVMKDMRETRARAAMTAGAFPAAKRITKKVKADIPSKNKDVRKAIGHRRLKVKEAPGGGAKVGARVAKGSRAQSANKSGKGVGIGARNVHWFLDGTNDRFQPTRSGGKRYVGAMWGKTQKPTVPMYVYVRRNRAELMRLFKVGAWKSIQKSVEQGKAF